MKLNRKQRVIGFFVLVALMPFALLNRYIGWSCFVLGLILEHIGEFCLNLDISLIERYYKFIKRLK